MNKRFDFLGKPVLFSFWFTFLHLSSIYGFERQKPVLIPPHSVFPPLSFPIAAEGFCLIQYDQDSVSYYFDRFGAGDGIAVYMNPGECGLDSNSTYPFKLTNVHFYLYDYPGYFVWPVEIKVNLRQARAPEDSIKSPGGVLFFKTFLIPSESSYATIDPRPPMNLALDTVFCVNSPFFLEVIYTGATESPYPSLILSDSADRPQINQNWLLWNNKYYEWDTAWVEWEKPGRAIMRITGYPQAIDCHICWYWKPKTTKAPGGMPDFDQYQFGSDVVALDAPTAVANCLVWLNAFPSITDPDSLIRLLAHYFHTNPLDSGGTFVDSIKVGLDSLFAHYNLNLYDSVIQNPTFSVMADSLKGSGNVVLLIGLWQEMDDTTWYRFGGHYVSMAGVCKLDSLVALSDPAVDNAESGAKGRVLPTHPAHPDDDTLHNTKGFVSQDAYVSDTISVGPYTGLWRLKDYRGGNLPWFSQFEGENFQTEQMQYAHSYDSTKSVYAVVEYAIMICPPSPEACWYWKPDTSSAPHGMPDFDQYQFGSDTIALDAPSAVANGLVWLDAIPSITNPDSLIRLLSYEFHTDPSDSGGTFVDSINVGLDSLFARYGLNLYDTVIQNPTFFSLMDSFKNSANIVLLLGLWQKTDDTTWNRFGGHYVSMAGGCGDSSWLAISDPARDNAEAGARGRVLPPHGLHSDDHTLHNNKAFVSQDVFVSDTISAGPYAGLWRLKDYDDGSVPWLSQFEGENFQPEQLPYAHPYDSTKTVYALVEYAILIFQKPTFVAEEEETETPGEFALYQNHPNPFNPPTTLSFTVNSHLHTTLVIYNILGQKVRILVDEPKMLGSYEVIWDGKDEKGNELASGIYFYQLKVGDLTQTKRMVLLK